jgi:glutathione S-transferase
MTEELVFYTNPMSRGRIARWMLEEIGQPYRTEYLDFGTTMKAPDYLSMNPMGKVPAIKHGDTVVTEGAAICAYLAETFPQAGLAPTAAERGRYFRWMFFAAGPMEMAVTNRALGFEIPPERLRMAGCGSLDNVFDTLEQAVSVSPYIAGGLNFGTIEKRPAYIDYWNRVSDRDAYRRGNELDNAAMPKQANG